MELYNILEFEVKQTLEYLLKNNNDIGCSCDHCKNDIMAIALNSLPPKYIVTDKGLLYTKLANFNQQFNTDIVTALAKAIKQVNDNPRHE